jgi:AbrB family looped-hinge helix DNA binding protein
MPTVTLTSKGQITIPIEIRRKLRLKDGDKIDFFETEEGMYAMRPKTGSIMELKGILKKMGYVKSGPAPTIREMDDAIAQHVAEMDRRTMSDYQNEDKDEA